MGSRGAGEKAKEVVPREGWREVAVLSVPASHFNWAALAMPPCHPHDADAGVGWDGSGGHGGLLGLCILLMLFLEDLRCVPPATRFSLDALGWF